MRIRYFAWLRQRIGVAEETLEPPAEVGDVAGLLAWLKARGAPYDTAFEPDAVIDHRCHLPSGGLDAGGGAARLPPLGVAVEVPWTVTSNASGA